MVEKICSKCKITKNTELFAKDKRSSDKLSSWCKKCHCGATKKWKLENSKKVKATAKLYNYSLHGRFTTAKKTSKQREIKWSLSFEDFEELVSDPCFYCEGFLGSNNRTGSGLDRVDSDQGYYYDNLVPCCIICNKIKNNFLTLNETLVAVESIIKLRRNNHGK